MKKYFYFIICIGIITTWSSCRNDFEFEPNTGNLEFSRDTVFLDTVFTNIGSSTFTLKVFNRSNDDIVIPRLRLGDGQNSFYRLNVSGSTGVGPVLGKEFENVEIFARDSIFIFIETTIDIEALSASETQFLYTDAIEFDTGTNQQTVDLITLVQDAVFIFPSRSVDQNTGERITETLNFDADGDGIEDETTIEGRFLTDDELTFTNERPYVIFGFAGVNEGQTLNIEAGARIHFHADSGILVTDGGSIHVNGLPSTDPDLLEGEVIFEGDRLEPNFSEIPGQWQTIWLFQGSTNNIFNHATIKNGTAGILVDGNQNDITKLNITNSQIYNSSNFGILARASNVNGENVAINNSGQSSFAGTFGGRYNFANSTLVNFWTISFRQFPSVLLNNFALDGDNNTITNPLEEANFTNCIIFGNDNPELILDADRSETFNFKFTNSLIRFQDTNGSFTGPLYDFSNTDLYENIIFNNDPNFLDPNDNRLEIPNGSPADGAGIIFGNLLNDIINTPRDVPRDIGAYESIEFIEE